MTGYTFEIEVLRWECPLGRCNWAAEFLTDSDAKDAFLTGGEIHRHVEEAHILMEWVQEVMDLRGGIERAKPATLQGEVVRKELAR